VSCQSTFVETENRRNGLKQRELDRCFFIFHRCREPVGVSESRLRPSHLVWVTSAFTRAGWVRVPMGRLLNGPLVGDRSPSNALASAAFGAHATSAAAAAVATAARRRRSATETTSSLALRSVLAAHATVRRARGAVWPGAQARTPTELKAHVDIDADAAVTRRREWLV
jgi:hypothetical protein